MAENMGISILCPSLFSFGSEGSQCSANAYIPVVTAAISGPTLTGPHRARQDIQNSPIKPVIQAPRRSYRCKGR